jgi:hypothetical protein
MSLVDEMTAAVDGLVRRTVSPIAEQVRALVEWRASVGQLKSGADGLNGKDGENGRDGRDGKDGRDGERGEKGADGIAGKDGRDGVDGKDGAIGLAGKDGADGINGKDGSPGLAGKDGKDGLGIERIEVGEKSFDIVLADGVRVEVPLLAGPAGVNGKDGAPGVHGKDGRDGIDGRNGADGINGKDGSDGIHGKDGAAGLKGDKGDPPTAEEVESIIAKLMPQMIEKRLTEAVEKAVENATPSIIARTAILVPPGRDGLPGRPGTPGEDGKDGRDGFSLESVSLEMKDGRTLVQKYRGGDREMVAEVVLEGMPIDTGIFSSTREYKKGDGATYGGSYWIRLTDGIGAPPSDQWRLAVKGTR